MDIELRVLGTVETVRDGVVLAPGPARRRAVLAILAVEAGKTVTVDQLVDRLWHERPPQRARETLHSYISRIRKDLGGGAAAITRRGGGYQLDVDADAVDMHRFARLAADARLAEGARRRIALWREALGLWRGEPFGDLDVPWLGEIAHHLRQRRFLAAVELNELRLARGEHAELLPELMAAVAEHPLNERVAGQLMLALYRTGRAAEALGEYTRVRGRLVDDVGREPGEELKLLHRRMLNDDAELSLAEGSTEAAEPRAAIDFAPMDVTGFVGREQQLAELDGLLDEMGGGAAVISALSGGGGVGKSALAVRWAHSDRVRQAFGDGTLFVRMQGFSGQRPLEAHQALGQVLRQLGVPSERIPHELEPALAEYRRRVADRRLLIILDDAVDAAQVRPLLASAPRCLVLVTSRNRLAGLAVREGARQIFVDRLGRNESLELLRHLLGDGVVGAEPEAVERLAELCARLPLALRIAAAGFRASFAESTMGEYVEELASDRLGMLDLDSGEAAVSTVLSWSLRDLSADVAEAFALLGVHPGPSFDAPAAAAMLDATEAAARRLLRELSSASLLEQVRRGRYVMHDLLRDFARDRLPTPPTVRDAAHARLLAHYRDLMESRGKDVDWFLAEQSILVNCLRLPVAGQAMTSFANQLGDRLHDLATYPDGLRAFEIAHANADAGTTMAADALAGIGRLTRALGEWDRARAAYDEALDLYRALGNVAQQAWTLRGMAEIARATADHHASSALTGEALALFQGCGDRKGEANCLLSQGQDVFSAADYTASVDKSRRAAALARDIGERFTEAQALHILGQAQVERGEYAAAARDLEHSLSIYAELGFRGGQGSVLIVLSRLAGRTGDKAAALSYARRSLTLDIEVGDRLSQAHSLHALGRAALATGDFHIARDNLVRARELCLEFGDRVGEAYTSLGVADATLACGDHDGAATEYRRGLAI
ncbi:MAG TPA: BTAD domain-containing putative transcriptional regulator, partial [Stackebrandtia sp.]|uniref:AfsR/SARP family transcriptional regulator n=1 Tax=Stackebrandtia sp. TaxID=2023065 RepID=UPI002D2B2847